MPVNNTHPEFDTMVATWIRARDVLSGEDAIKATARTLAGYVGMIFLKPPYVRLPEMGGEPAKYARCRAKKTTCAKGPGWRILVGQ